MNIEGFVTELLREFSDNGHGDLDGVFIEDLLITHGFAKYRALTAEEAAEEWAVELGLEEGDKAVMYAKEMKDLMK